MLCLFLCGLEDAAAKGFFEKGFKAGVRTIGYQAEDYGSMQIAVWYPTMRGEREDTTKFGDWEVRAVKNAKPASGPFPIVIISHDTVSHGLAHHQLASHLAENGFVVIAVSHAGDNFQNAGAMFSSALLYYRPRQVHEALKRVSDDEALGPVLDKENIGLLGVGLGALTALQLAGVDIDSKAYAGYCEREDRDEVFCTDWARVRLAVLEQESGALRAKYGPKAFVAELGNLKAVGMLAPGGIFLADRTELSRVNKPVGIFFAGLDDVYRPALAREALLQIFPMPLFDRLLVQVSPKADHESLAAPLPERQKQELLLKDGRLKGSERRRSDRARDRFFLSFFGEHLGTVMAVEHNGD